MFTRKFIFTSKKWAGGEENVQSGMGNADSVLGSLILNRRGKLGQKDIPRFSEN